MKYILISVCNREITTEKFNNLDKARKQMKKEYNEAISNGENYDEAELNENDAWANVDDSDYQYDWLIDEIKD